MLNETVQKLDCGLEEAELQISTAGRLLSFLLQSNQHLQEKCQDLKNRQRRNNLRIYGRNGHTINFIDPFVKQLNLSSEFNLGTERAYRSLHRKKEKNQQIRQILRDQLWSDFQTSGLKNAFHTEFGK